LQTLEKIWSISSVNLRLSYFYFAIISIFNSIIEIAAISSILPLLDLFINQNGVFITKLNEILGAFISIEENNITQILYFMIGIFVLKFFINYITIHFYQKIIFDLRIYLAKKKLNEYLNQDYKFFIKNNSSILLRNISQEVPRVILGVIAMLLSLFSEVVMILSIVTLLILIDLKSAIFIFGLLIAIGSIYMAFSKKYINRLGKLRIDFEGNNMKNLREIFDNIKLLKLYSRENFFFQKFNLNNKISSKSHMKFNIAAQTPRLFYEFILILILLLFCIFFSENLQNLIYILAIYAAGAIRLIPSISKMLSALQNIRFEIPALNEIATNRNEIKKNLIISKNNTDEEVNFKESIEFKNINFTHFDSKKIVFNKLNLKILKDSFVGIFGSSGIGKSTFFDLFSGIVLPLDGKIIIDKKYILKKQNIKSWQNLIGYMPQDAMILEGSLTENIAFGEDIKNINFKDIETSLDGANLNHFASNLKDSENLQLGERGLKISGGERQRISLARTLYTKPKILLLDEVTSALDQNNENEILKTIYNLKNTTKILISHNKEALKYCDKIYELKDKNFLETKLINNK
jgi:ABC-type bacteriocin/lantibiotic exporter with double-glycine peptidase domain